MDDQFGNPTGRHPDGSVAFDTDVRAQNQMVRFYKRKILNTFKSEQTGAPVYDWKDFLEIIFPGDKTQIYDQEVTRFDKKTYARQWEQFASEAEQTHDGILLEHLFPGQPAVVEGLKEQRFHTVEQLANASDSAIASVAMGGLEYREKAKKYLEYANGTGKFLQIEKRLADLEFENNKLKDTVVAQKMALESDDDGERRGRPRKAA